MNTPGSFGELVKAKRRELGLTQDELARRVGCAPVTLRKIEYDDLRPSVQIAERLAMALNLPLEERPAFVRLARQAQEKSWERPSTPTPKADEIGREDLSGRFIRGYALGELIGKGGMGVVYRGVQPLVQREVAIKIILPQYANHPDFIRRFEAEAQLVAHLEHPHIVPLYDYWREPNLALLVMRLLRGGSLAKLLENGPPPLELTLQIMEQIGSALGTAHRQGVIHRDLKPGNILLDEQQNAYLADFGIAKQLAHPDLSQVNLNDASLGSPAYISPEQIHSEYVRPQTDIYCLGIVLYELLTGHTPYTGPTSVEVMHQHLVAPLPPLAARRPGLPATLDTILQHATCKEPLERYPEVDSLLDDLRQVLGGMRKTFTPIIQAKELPPLTAADNPYKGLRAFAESDAPDFFGREALVQQLLERLGEGGDLSRLLAVVGPSGSGKSSAVKAGLIPALRRGALPGSEHWYVVDIHPGEHPFEEIRDGLLRIAVNPPAALQEQLQADRRGLLRAVERCLPRDPAVELVLVIDQFEEVFTLLADEPTRQLLLDSLVCAALDESSRLRVILTLRADFTDRPLQYVDFGELLRQRMELVLPLTPDELEQAITEPAGRVGLQVEAELAAAIGREVGLQPGALPLLQYALTELYDQRRNRTLTKAAYQSIGGVASALSRRAEQTYLELDAASQAAARQCFLRLVTLGEGVEDTRRRVLRTELLSLTPNIAPNSGADQPLTPIASPLKLPDAAGKMDDVIEAFGRVRLLSFDRDPATRSPTVEVAHEALLREWSRLRGWLEESRDDLRLQRRLTTAATEWAQAGKEPGFLAAGARLDQFQALAQKNSLALTPAELEYIAASLAERQRQRAREHRSHNILNILRTMLVLAGIAATVLAGVALQQRQEALRQASVGLAAQALAELEGIQSERGVLLALEALEYYPYTPQAEIALSRAVQETLPYREFAEYPGYGGFISLAWSPDGSQIAVGGVGNAMAWSSVQIWDVASGEVALALPLYIDYNAGEYCYLFGVAWSPDGNQLAVVANGTPRFPNCHHLKIYDTHSSELVLSLDTQGDVSVDWSPDGRSLLTGGEAGEVRLWDAQSGELMRESTGHTLQVYAARFSPDGTLYATGSHDGILAIWDTESGDILISYGEPFTNNVTDLDFLPTMAIPDLAWSPDGARLAVAYGEGIARVFDIRSGQLVFDLTGHSAGITDIDWSADGRYLATLSSSDGMLRLWQAGTGWPTLTLTGKKYSLGFSPDGRFLAAGYQDIRLWDLAALPPVMPYPPDPQGWTDLQWSPDGRFISNAYAVHDSQKNYQGLEISSGGLYNQWSPDSQRLVATGLDGITAVIIDAVTNEVLVTAETLAPLPDGTYVANAWSPDGTRTASSIFSPDGCWLLLWDPQTGEELARTETFDCYLQRPNFSPDSKYVATGCMHIEGNTPANIFDASTGELVRQLPSQDGWSYTAMWSPDGSYLAVSYEKGVVRVWDTQTWEVRQAFASHQGEVWNLDWSPNGERIISGDINGTAFIWDVASGQAVESFTMPWMWSVAWSPDGGLVGGANDTMLSLRRAWQSTEELIAYAHECCVWRELTSEERTQFGLPVSR